MLIGDRLKALPEQKKLSQGDIGKRSGLLRCYVFGSRTGTAFQLSRRWRKSRGPCEFRGTNFFMTARSLRLRGSQSLMAVGADLAMTLER
jgi:hypothetical protein